jgi:hypothetical protein
VGFPNLVLTPDGVLHATGTGVPTNGVNEFDAGVNLALYDKLIGAARVDTWLVLRVWALGTSVIGASYVGRTGNKIRVSFQQTGVDSAFIELSMIHSVVR